MSETFNIGILGPAFLAGLLVLATHVPLGKLVLDRGIVFIDLAIAQAAGLGVVLADVVGWEPNGWSVQASAAIAAMIGAGFLVWTEKKVPALQEAIIGVVFVVAASAEVILFGFNPHGAEHLKDLLVGQILWVTPAQLIPVALLYLVVLACWKFVDLKKNRIVFYVIFAFTITASVQLIGVFLVFASLIVPALTAEIIAARNRLRCAYLVGLGGYAGGLLSSAFFDFPTGAAIVCALFAIGLMTSVLGAHRSTRR